MVILSEPWKNLLDIFHTLKQLQLVSSEKGVGGKRGGGEIVESRARARSSASSANPGTCAPSRGTAEDPAPGQPWAPSHDHPASGPARPAAAHPGPRRHPLLQERTTPASACCALGHGDPRPFRGGVAGRSRSRVGCTIRPRCRSLLRPGFIVCGAFWGRGGSCASAAATTAAATVASAARWAGGGRGLTVLVLPAGSGSPLASLQPCT